MATDNILDVVEELRQIVADLKRTLYGDQATRTAGVLTEFDSLRKDVQALQGDVQRLKERRPAVWVWIAGYLCFATSVTFGVVGILNLIDGHNVFGVPAAVALWLAAMLASAALLLFISGFGWLDGRA